VLQCPIAGDATAYAPICIATSRSISAVVKFVKYIEAVYSGSVMGACRGSAVSSPVCKYVR